MSNLYNPFTSFSVVVMGYKCRSLEFVSLICYGPSSKPTSNNPHSILFVQLQKRSHHISIPCIIFLPLQRPFLKVPKTNLTQPSRLANKRTMPRLQRLNIPLNPTIPNPPILQNNWICLIPRRPNIRPPSIKRRLSPRRRPRRRRQRRNRMRQHPSL